MSSQTLMMGTFYVFLGVIGLALFFCMASALVGLLSQSSLLVQNAVGVIPAAAACIGAMFGQATLAATSAAGAILNTATIAAGQAVQCAETAALGTAQIAAQMTGAAVQLTGQMVSSLGQASLQLTSAVGGLATSSAALLGTLANIFVQLNAALGGALLSAITSSVGTIIATVITVPALIVVQIASFGLEIITAVLGVVLSLAAIYIQSFGMMIEFFTSFIPMLVTVFLQFFTSQMTAIKTIITSGFSSITSTLSTQLASMVSAIGSISPNLPLNPTFNVSDRRLKDNLVVLGEVHGLKFYRWTWNETAKNIDPSLDGEGVGFLAQDVLLIYPSYVRDGAHGYMELNEQIYADLFVRPGKEETDTLRVKLGRMGLIQK